MRAPNIWRNSNLSLLEAVLILTLAQLMQLNAQRSFAAMKFELNPDLPIEDLTVAGFNRDEKPAKVEKEDKDSNVPPKSGDPADMKKKKNDDKNKKDQTTVNAQYTTTVVPPKVEAPQELSQEIVPFSSHSHAFVPPRPTQTNNAQINNTQSTTPPAQTQIYVTQTEITNASQQQQQKYQEQQQQQRSQQQKQQGVVLKERPEEWFREEFDTRDCARDGESVARAFNRKFPRNLLRHGKEAMLAELLATRIRECRDKHDGDHWTLLDAFVAQASDAPATEREECMAGIIEEQIACMNVISFSCQFIQPSYAFRLLPTRLIVQEARFAEDGAEKCRKFVRKLKAKKPRRN